MGILFRNSMLINSILTSSEVLYGIEMKHIKMLETCDKTLLLRMFSAPATCSYEAIYFETGCLPIRFILQGRRLMYYWTLLNKGNNELVKRFFSTQKEFSSKDDWILQVEEDKKSLDINLSDTSMKTMKKQAFKKLIKGKLNKKATEFLIKCKTKENRSKSKYLKYYSFQNYLQTNKLSTKDKKLLFSLRTRSIDVKTNYKNKYKFDMTCRLCKDTTEDESETHLLKCSKIIENVDIDLSNAQYENIYSDNLEEQISITKIFSAIFKARFLLLNVN